MNLTGKTFGRLTVLKKGDSISGRCYWECRCICGNIAQVRTDNLKSKQVRSCGCLKNESSRNMRHTGALGHLFRKYKDRAKSKGLRFNITIDEFHNLITSNCRYCGTPPNQVLRRSDLYIKEYFYNGVDRIDSIKGYVINNVVPCCGTCNTAKLSMSVDEFLTWVKKVYTHNKDLQDNH